MLPAHTHHQQPVWVSWQVGLGSKTYGHRTAMACPLSGGALGCWASPSHSTRWCCNTAILPGLHSACTAPAAKLGGHWFGSPCRLGTLGEPSRVSSGWSAPCQVGWRATRDGTCHQLYPKRETALTLGWTCQAPCQPGAAGGTDRHTVRTRAAPTRGARCPSISHRHRRLRATCLPSSLFWPYPCQAGGCTRSPKGLRPRLTGQWGSLRPNTAPSLCWGPACSVGCPTAMPWCSMGGKEQQLQCLLGGRCPSLAPSHHRAPQPRSCLLLTPPGHHPRAAALLPQSVPGMGLCAGGSGCPQGSSTSLPWGDKQG